MRLPSFNSGSSRARRDSDGTLHEYVFKNDVRNVKTLLLRDDVDINACDENGKTPIFIAASFNRYEILEVLLTSIDVNVNATDAVGNTALHEAADKGNLDIIRRLIKCDNCDVDVRNNVGETSLMKAAYYDYADIARVLIRDGNADLDLTDDCGQTALLIALRESSHVTADLLLKCGCDVKVTDHLGHSAFYVAIHSPRNRSLDLAKLLLGSGYDIINDSKWLIREEKHNIFYQDDEFYSRICENVKHVDSSHGSLSKNKKESQRQNETRSLLRRTTSADLQLIKAASSYTKTNHEINSAGRELPRQTSLPLTSSTDSPPPLVKPRSASDSGYRVAPASIATVARQKKVSFSKDSAPLTSLTKPKSLSSTKTVKHCPSILKQERVSLISDPASKSTVTQTPSLVKAKLIHKLSSDSETESQESDKRNNVKKHQKVTRTISDRKVDDTNISDTKRPSRYPRLTRSISGQTEPPSCVKVPTRYPHVTHKLSSSSEELLSPPDSPKQTAIIRRPSHLLLDNKLQTETVDVTRKSSLGRGLLHQMSLDSFEIRSLPNYPRLDTRRSQKLLTYTPPGSPNVTYRRQLSVRNTTGMDKSEQKLRKTSLPCATSDKFATEIRVTGQRSP